MKKSLLTMIAAFIVITASAMEPNNPTVVHGWCEQAPPPCAVPETCSTLVLLGIGIGGIAIARYYKKQQA